MHVLASYRVQFRLNHAGFFAHLPNLRVVCGNAIHHCIRDSERNTRAQHDRVLDNTLEQIIFVDYFLPNFVFV